MNELMEEMIRRADEPLCDELKGYVTSDPSLGWECLRHPLVYSVPLFPSTAWMSNEQLKGKRESIQALLATGRPQDAAKSIWLWERPYRAQALWDQAAGGKLPPEVYWPLVADVWVDSENIAENRGLWRKLWWASFDKSLVPHRHLTMSEPERAALAAMPDPIPVYHGEEQPGYIGM